jgi:hypothetical protein
VGIFGKSQENIEAISGNDYGEAQGLRFEIKLC